MRISPLRCLGLTLVCACGPEIVFDPTPGAADDASSDTSATSGAAPTSTATEAGTTGADEVGETGETGATGETGDTAEETGGGSSGGDPLSCPPIADPGLEQLIRGRLEIPEGPIPRAVAEAQEVLSAPGLDIPTVASLAGIECLANLREVWITGGVFTDLGPLAALTLLEEVDFQGNLQLTDLGPLATSTTLRDLVLYGTAVADLAPLAGVKTLELVDVRGATQVSDLGPLAGLPLLRLLLASDTAITDIAVVAELPALESLHIRRTKVSSFAPLAGHALVSLMADETTPVDLTGLGQATALGSLSLSDSGVTDLSGLAGAPALTNAHLTGNAIVDLGPLAGIATLRDVSLDGNLIVDLSPLAGLPELWRLNIDDNQVVDLGPLVNSPLTFLHAADNAISDPSPLAQLQLSLLDLSRNPVGPQLDQLGQHPGLGELWLAEVGLTKVPVIPPGPLVLLDLTGNAVVDVTPLADYPFLTTLTLTDNDITELSPLLGAPWLGDENCTSIALAENPLSADSLMQVLPVLCAGPDAVLWDGGECNVCELVPI